MNIEILKEKPMRGCLFENLSKIIVRRIQKHNFIFVTRQFDSLKQILERYNLKSSDQFQRKLDFIKENFHRFDLLEFKLSQSKEINDLIIYDVKTKYYSVKRSYFEFCKSNYDFLCEYQDKYAGKIKIASIVMFRHWNCDMQIFNFDRTRCRIYKYRAKINKK